MSYSLSLHILWKGYLQQQSLLFLAGMLCIDWFASEQVRPEVCELPVLFFVNLAVSSRASPPEDAAY